MDINVSVAILVNINKQVLLAQRPPPKSWEGWWEFPGGKIEKNETPVDALHREVYEEIGVKITQFTKWVTRKYSHEGNDIKLHFFKVYKWEGEIVSKEIEILLNKAKADDQIKLGVMSTLLDELKTKEE